MLVKSNLKIQLRFLSAVLVFFTAGSLYGAELSPVGLWKTVDDQTGQTKGLIRISESNGQFEGKIDKIFLKPGDDPTPRCGKCEGSKHNQPVLGLTFLWGFTKQGDEYQGGEILDPQSGKVYQAKMKVIDGGKKLEVRGFIGMSVFGRSQVWLRAE